MNNPTRQASLFQSLSVLAALLATTCLAPAQAVFIRADNNAALNTANAWLTNGITPSRVPTTNDTLVWDNTVSAANAVGNSAAAVTWGQIIVSNPPATVEITNNSAITLNGRIFNGTTNGLTLEGNNLSVLGQVIIRSNQSWTIGSGRTLTLQGGGGEFDVNRSLTLNGTGTINVVGGNLTPGTFTLIDYNSLAGGGFGAFAEGTYPRGVDADLVDNFGNSSVDLQINSVDPVIWSGATDNIWDTNTANWTLLAAPTAYIDGDSVLFPEGAANTSIQIVSNWSPLGVVVSNDATTYTFNAPTNTGIIGPTGLIKRGTGLLNLGSSNRYSGPTTVSAGTLRFLTNDVLPSTGGTLTVDGVLDVNGFSDTVTALDGTGVVSNSSPNASVLSFGGGGGSGSFSGTVEDNGLLILRKTGGGTNVLTAASPNWNGGATLDAGTLAFSDDLALGVGTLVFEGTATLAPLGARSLPNAIEQNSGGEGRFDTTGGNLTLTGAINWYGGADMNKDGSNVMTLSSTATVKLGLDAELAVNGGQLIIDGASVTVTNDGLCTRATTNFINVTLTIGNGASITLMSNANLTIGASANTNLVTPDLTNTVTHTSGTTTFEGGGGLFVGSAAGNVGVLHHDGGTITFAAINSNGVTICNGTNTVGTYYLNSGATLVTPRIRETFLTNDVGTPVPQLANSTFVFSGGTLRASSGLVGTNFISGLDTVLVQAASAFIDSDAYDIDINQALLEDPFSPNGGLVKNGSGSLALNGVNTFSGAITVNAGLLRGRGSVVGTVSGAGKIGGGDIDELGTFTVNAGVVGAVAVTGGAVMRVSHVGAVLSNDKVSAPVGVMTHAGELTLIPIGADFAVGDQFDLFDAATINGSFTSYNLGLLPPGLSWDTTDVSTTGIVRIVRTTQVQTITSAGNVNQITLGGIGPAASTGYRVLSTTNMALPVNLWTVYTNGTFDVSSNFSSVISVNSNDTRRFFIIINP
jgi:autotransporter-associated beta strand protein